MRRLRIRLSVTLIAALLFRAAVVRAQTPGASAPSLAPATAAAPWTYQEVMVPMRDGVHLQTVIITPTDQHGPLPILFRRTPYGVPEKAPSAVPPAVKELAADGYIFVTQNLRGRFKSEGTFALTSQTNLADSTATSETTDAYDSIEWLTTHVKRTNGRVGMRVSRTTV